MALRKNNQKDFDKFNNTSTDVLKNKKDNDPPKKVAGEHTGPIRKDKSGTEYSIVGEGDPDFEYYAGNTVAKGDTIKPSIDPMFGGQWSDFGRTVDGFIPGGDYDLTETKDSKKRSSGPRTYNIKN